MGRLHTVLLTASSCIDCRLIQQQTVVFVLLKLCLYTMHAGKSYSMPSTQILEIAAVDMESGDELYLPFDVRVRVFHSRICGVVTA